MSGLFNADGHATPLTPEEQLELIPSLSTRAELNAAERTNILAGRVWAMRPRTLKRDDLLTDGFARELHKRMFGSVWKWAGRYRTTERNLGWAPHLLTEGVHNALADARTWLEFGTYPLHETAVRLHHRLVAIHPWPNGNGRHSRLMADLCVAARGGEELTWAAGGDIEAAGEIRKRYIEAIKLADAGDYGPLVAFARS